MTDEHFLTFTSSLKFTHTLAFGLPWWLSGKESPAIQEMQEMLFPSLGREDPLEKEMAIHSNILSWRIPRTEEHRVPKGQTQLKRLNIHAQPSK